MAVPAKTSVENRRYPRSSLKLKAKVAVLSGRSKSALEATLRTNDISLTGMFIESTFFMKVGTKVQVTFTIPKDPRAIIANGIIVREERGGVRTGFAIHFSDFVADSAVVLAALFLAPRVKRFVEKHTKTRREADLPTELDRLIDVVVGWELAKTQHDNIW